MTQPIRALLFDVFGTVVDWRGSIIREGERLNQKHGWQIDWGMFADAWRAGYQPAMEEVRSGARPWVNLDTLNREILERLLSEVGLELPEPQKAHLNRVWHRLLPWPDSVGGLQQLKAHAVIASLSNGHVALLTNMAKHAGLPWDCVLSAELAKHYKPQPEAYLTAVQLLDLNPEQVMMVAAHEDDLQAARRNGLKTAFVCRPLEYGPARTVSKPADDAYDIVVDNFYDLAHEFTVRFV